MSKMGRPTIEIDKDQFEDLCSFHCTEEEIASFFRCSPDTISRWCQKTYENTFAEVKKEKMGRGRANLRRKMFQTAMGGNISMMIWLSKQYLKMEETPQHQPTDVQPTILTRSLTREEAKKLIEEMKQDVSKAS